MKCETIDKIPPEKAMELLKADGIDVNVDQAKIILTFLYEMAEIAVDQYLDQSDVS